MTQPNTWTPAEAHSTAALLHSLPQPLTALADGDVPAVVLRGAYPPDHCQGLMRRFEERGYFDPATVGQAPQLSGGPYLDLGTSLGRLGADPDAFFAHAVRTHELFATLFEGFTDPVRTMYAALSDLAESKIVQTAREPDGQLYGPAIFRMYHAAEGHKPHYDSVAKRSRPGYEYAVADFQRQFAGVLCLQTGDEASADEPFIYRCCGAPSPTSRKSCAKTASPSTRPSTTSPASKSG